jgi:hypothetical protein
MRRPFAVVLLSLGTIVGFSTGFANLHHSHAWGRCGGDAERWQRESLREAPRPVAPAATAAPVSPTTVYIAPTFAPPQAYPPPAPPTPQAYPVYLVPVPTAPASAAPVANPPDAKK